MSQLRWLDRKACERITGFSFADLIALARHIDKHYHPVLIHKGKRRTLHIPSPHLKLIQTRLYRRAFRGIPFHNAVYCRKGRGILDVAKAHASRKYLLHLDIKDFFPSVGYQQVREAFKRLGVHRDLVPTLTRIVTKDNGIPQGAPTSVAVANMVLHHLDVSLSGLCLKNGLTYTRYIDDIAVSGGSRLARFEQTIRRIITESCGWQLNDKGGLLHPNEKHTIVGLIVTTKPNVDPSYYSALHWLVKRIRDGKTSLADRQFETLRGRIEWICAVNPARGEKLRNLLSNTRATPSVR